MVWERLAERVGEYERVFGEFVRRLVQRFGGRVTIVLFGSRAAGRHGPSSDFDVLVVLDGLGDYFETAAEVRAMGRGAPMDLVLLDRADFAVDGVVRDMLRRHVCVYDGLGICDEITRALEGDPPNT